MKVLTVKTDISRTLVSENHSFISPTWTFGVYETQKLQLNLLACKSGVFHL